ncbi:hypothetical protein BS78_06G043500 [Paspalum vaginatum]|nr:hypothetical protein BS78_06G043500 [Paspalum vaginatum]
MEQRKQIFTDDYDLVREDNEVTYFIRQSFQDVKVADVGDIVLTVRMLRPNVIDGYMYGQVIDAYAYLCDLDTDSTSVLTTIQSQWLIQHAGAIPTGCGNQWVAAIATKCVGRNLVYIPLNTYDVHWILLVLNVKKKRFKFSTLYLAQNFEKRLKKHCWWRPYNIASTIHFRVA